MTLRSAEAHYSEQAALAEVVRRRIEALFGQVQASDVNAWSALIAPASRLVTAAQLRAARAGESYVADALEEQGDSVAPEATVVAASLPGRASDGRPLPTLLDQPRIQALTAIGQGLDTNEALSRAVSSVTTMAVTQVQDVGRLADGLATFVRPRIGYRRMVNPPCCQRCAILAGKWFRSNTGFKRHPRCDCRHIPCSEDAPGDVATDPRALFDSGNVRGATPAELRAIADGADPGQVINARRGAQGMFTTEGVTKRGVAGRVLIERGGSVRDRSQRALRITRNGPEVRTIERRVARLRRATPESIYEFAESREDALNLLAQNGYIIRR